MKINYYLISAILIGIIIIVLCYYLKGVNDSFRFTLKKERVTDSDYTFTINGRSGFKITSKIYFNGEVVKNYSVSLKSFEKFEIKIKSRSEPIVVAGQLVLDQKIILFNDKTVGKEIFVDIILEKSNTKPSKLNFFGL